VPGPTITRSLMAEIEYDESLCIRLDTVVLPVIAMGRSHVEWCGDVAARHATCLRFVTLHDLAYDWNPDTGEFTIYPPD
jgi:hypothetical protein